MKLTGATKESTKFTFEVVTGRHEIYRGLDQIATADDNESAQLIIDALNERERLRAAIQKFVDAYSNGKEARLGNGQARRSLDEFRQILNDATTSTSAGGG